MPEEKTIEFKVDRELKQEFLDKQKAGTRETYGYALKRADEMEQELGKKIYDFNFEERDELILTKFKNKSKWVVQSTLSPLKRYIDFCISKNVVRHFENRFSMILTKDYDKYVNVQAQTNIFISKEENRELQKKLVNAQDKLILELIGVYGIRGRTEVGNTHEELINLMTTDVDYQKHILTVVNNDNKPKPRYVQVDEYTLDLIKEAIGQETYMCKNGVGTTRDMIINNSIYVFRTPGRNKYDKVDQQLFTRRMQSFQKWLEKPYLTISSLWLSSLIIAAKKIKEENGEITREDYKKLNGIFNYGQNEEQQTLYWVKTRDLIEPYL
jgi:site-specific recombinase XerD